MAAVDLMMAFGLKWGENGSVEVIDETQWRLGWAFIGATPPSVEQFNKVHQIGDEKSNWLYAQIKAVTDAAGLTLTQGNVNSLRSAMGRRLLRVSRYSRVSGVQNLSVDGAANTTTGAGSFTRLAGTGFVEIEVQGGGGAGGGAGGAGAGNVSVGAPGGSGAFGHGFYSATTVGSSALTVAVGLGGTGTPNGSGGSGGASSVGAVITASGGVGGGLFTNQAPPAVNGNGGQVTAIGANIFSAVGMAGSPSFALSVASAAAVCGWGGSSVFGQGAVGGQGNINGVGAENIGCGGSGCIVNQGGGNATGGAGAAGIVIIREYAA